MYQQSVRTKVCTNRPFVLTFRLHSATQFPKMEMLELWFSKLLFIMLLWTTQKAEKKYNGTTEGMSFFQHATVVKIASSSCIWSLRKATSVIVQFALSHRKPINSVLDGILSLHAASSGGSDFVVKLLIEQGAEASR